MYNRLKIWMKKEELNSSALANKINVNKATVSHILSGRNKPSIDFLEKLLEKYPNFNLNWLVTGVGYMDNKQIIMQDIDHKVIDKIVVFYDDNSFDEVNS